MTEDRAIRSGGSRRVLTLALLCVAAVAGSGVLHLTGSDAFQPYYGPIHPVLGTAAVLLLGFGALCLLDAGDWVRIDEPRNGLRRFTVPALLATALAIPVVLVDLLGGFPPDLNLLPPQALLFYPVIALVAEAVFHVVPLALLLLTAERLGTDVDRKKVLVACLTVVALPEPIFQVVAGHGESPAWANVYVGVHLLVFNLLAVSSFRRNGFFSMLTLRLVYYAWWHVAWGVVRIRVLF